MDRKFLAAIIVIVVASTSFYLLWSIEYGKFSYGVVLGRRAVDIVVNGLNQTSFILHSHKGEVVVIEFITTRCGSCMSQTYELKRLQEAFSGVVIASIDVDMYLQEFALENWAAAMGIPWFIGHSLEAALAYKVRSVPTVVVIDGDGIIRLRDNYAPFEKLKLLVQGIQ